MSNYFEVYRRRATHLGNNLQEKAMNSGNIEFLRFCKYSENTVWHGLTREDGTPFIGVMLRRKQNENQVWEELLVDRDLNIQIGEMIRWDEEYWLVYFLQRSAYEPHRTYYVTRCEHEIKWVTDHKLHSAHIHLVSSMESKIKDNFRTWHSLITPQPNKFLEIIGKEDEIKTVGKENEVIIGDESWKMVDYDRISVPGVMYLSFVEGRVNLHRDDLENGIANADQIIPDLERIPYQIIGANNIRTTQTGTYQMVGEDGVTPVPASFSLREEDAPLASLKTSRTTCTVIANDQNDIGTVELKAVSIYGQQVTKQINIVSLWWVG